VADTVAIGMEHSDQYSDCRDRQGSAAG